MLCSESKHNSSFVVFVLRFMFSENERQWTSCLCRDLGLTLFIVTKKQYYFYIVIIRPNKRGGRSLYGND